jgi:hypothetical protein
MRYGFVARTVLGLTISSGLAAEGWAQSSGAPRSLCWRPRPQAECKAYLVTEMRFEAPLFTTRTGGLNPIEDFEGRFVWSVGPMWNRTTDVAWGALISFSSDDPDEVAWQRIEARYRKWIDRETGRDFSIGLARKTMFDSTGNRQYAAAGVTAGVSVERGYLGADARFDWLQGDGRDHRAGFVGAHTTGRGTPIATAVLVVGFFALFALLAGEGS